MAVIAQTTLVSPDVQSQLKKLNDHQSKWNDTSIEDKLTLLEEIEKLVCEVPMEEYHKLGEWTATKVMGFPSDTAEGQLASTSEAVIPLLLCQETIGKLVEAYKVACGKSTNSKAYDQKLKYQLKPSGDVVLPAFPLVSKDGMGPNAGLTAEFWLDPEKVKSVEEAPKPFDLAAFSENKSQGVLVVLGVGNQSFLTIVDVLEALFVRQRTVFIKHHALRGPGLDPLMRSALEPLFKGGFLDSCLDMTREENSALVYHPLVTAVHITGGKATHDAIVWGSTPEEQAANKANNTPKLDHAEMTSELGAITPWIMIPAKYTAKELQHHAEVLFLGLYSNASANCCAPKLVVLPESWDQKEEFLSILEDLWNSYDLPLAYYPGSQQRWDKYQKQYPSATTWEGKPSNNNRQLAPPMLNAQQGDKEACLLPLLVVDLALDLSDPKTKTAAKSEYAFTEEPFCPVLTLVTLPSETTAQYTQQAVELCNDFLLGTLSCSLSVPDAMKDDADVETALADLKYGSVAVNLWTASTYGFSWGGHSACETLECVKSGLGRINNYLFVPHLQKAVVKAPSTWSNARKMSPDMVQSKRELDAVAAFIRAPGVGTFVALMAATIKVPSFLKWGVAGAAIAAVAAITIQQKR